MKEWIRKVQMKSCIFFVYYNLRDWVFSSKLEFFIFYPNQGLNSKTKNVFLVVLPLTKHKNANSFNFQFKIYYNFRPKKKQSMKKILIKL